MRLQNVREAGIERVASEEIDAKIMLRAAIPCRSLQRCCDGVTDALAGSRGNERPEFPPGEGIDRTVFVSGDNGKSGGGSFEKDDPESLLTAGENE